MSNKNNTSDLPEDDFQTKLVEMANLETEIKAKIDAYNRAATLIKQGRKLGLLAGTENNYIDECSLYSPEANFWFSSSYGC